MVEIIFKNKLIKCNTLDVYWNDVKRCFEIEPHAVALVAREFINANAITFWRYPLTHVSPPCNTGVL